MNPSPALSPKRPVVLCILDGWGNAPDNSHNAVSMAHTPHWDMMRASAPHAALTASEMSVGLPAGQMGNSEVGHMTIGAGRVIAQDLPRINRAIEENRLASLPALVGLIRDLRQSGGVCHVMGLVSPGGVHAHHDHIIALAKIVAAAGIRVVIHAFTDGRDCAPMTAAGYIARMDEALHPTEARVVSLCGRFYAMDRDARYERVQPVWRALVHGQGIDCVDVDDAFAKAMVRAETDEFITPSVIGEYAGMGDGDGLLMANFRADRAREILHALVDPAFDGFPRDREVSFVARVGMVSYSHALDALLTPLFPAEQIEDTLGAVVSRAGLCQLRSAETEKYDHITFFLNGGREEPYEGEERLLVPSPKVRTYDELPAMSAIELTDKLCAAIRDGIHDLIVVNYANGDMVGHTGVFAAAVEAVQTLDACMGRLQDALDAVGGCMMITADHGNCETMRDENGNPHTAHTLNQVPFVLNGAPEWVGGVRDGNLSDIAPTVLALLGIAKPDAMTGESLIMPVEYAHADDT